VTFCRGVAGVLQITLRMIENSDSEPLREAASALAAALMSRFEPDLFFGYRGLDPNHRPVEHAGPAGRRGWHHAGAPRGGDA